MRHPRDRGSLSRRQFLQRSAGAAIALSGGGSLLAACASEGDVTVGTGTGAAPFELARQDNPVTLPLFDDNPAIAAGLEPEAGPITIFNTMDEAVAKLRSGGVDFDVFFPTVDRLGKLVAAKLLQPVNLSYIPNLEANIWPQLQSPFYDVGSRYTVPYVIYTTGIGYRTDKVDPIPDDLSNPYDIYFDEKYRGKT